MVNRSAGRLKWFLSTIQQTSGTSALQSSADSPMLLTGAFEPCGHVSLHTASRTASSSGALQSLRRPFTSSTSSFAHLTSRKPLFALSASRQQTWTSPASLDQAWGSGAPDRFAEPVQQQQQQQQQNLAPENDQLLESARMRTPQASSSPQPVPSTSAPVAMAKVSGTIKRITYRSDKTGYTVARMQVDSSSEKPKGRQANSNLVTVTGAFPDMSVGQQWQCEGRWVKHKAYGQQLDTHVATEVQPTDSSSLISYLCGGATKGIGPVTARNMVDTYGDRILNVLDSPDAVALLTKVHKIGPTTAAKIKDNWEQRRGDRGARDFLQKHGVSGAVAQRLVQKFGSSTEEVVRQDPYACLAQTSSSATFRAAEKLAVALGTPADLPSRLASAFIQALTEAASSNGHSYMSWEDLQQQSLTLLHNSGRLWSGAAAQEVAEDMFNNATLIVENEDKEPRDACHPKPDWKQPLRCYSPVMYNAEVAVARKLAELAARPPIKIPALQGQSGMARINRWMTETKLVNGQAMQLSEGQKEAIRTAAFSPVCILTGGPGCGKTTTTKYVVDLWAAMGRQLAICAPTGRAAQRLTETCSKSAATIHRLLKWVPSDKSHTPQQGRRGDDDDTLASGGRFTFNSRHPLKYAEEGKAEEEWREVNAVLVDEASMLDLPLAAALLEALPSRCQLVFVGDVDQLPPVGPGKVLSDAIQSGVIPGVDLRQIFRQAQQSNIVRAAHAVNRGDFQALPLCLPLAPAGPLQNGMHAQQGEAGSDAVMLEVRPGAFEAGVQLALQNLVHPRQKWDIRKDVQVMSPMHRTAAGVVALNAFLQGLLNPASPDKAELALTRSHGSTADYNSSPVALRERDRVIQCSNNYQKDVFNGDIGFVTKVKSATRELWVQYQDKEVAYKGAEVNDVQLAWASTIHKAQGSECPVVVLVLSPQHRPLLTRRLLYTALTRAKQLVVVVGSWDALKMAVNSERSDQRKSTLQQRISKLAVAAGATPNQRMHSYGAMQSPAPAAAASFHSASALAPTPGPAPATAPAATAAATAANAPQESANAAPRPFAARRRKQSPMSRLRVMPPATAPRAEEAVALYAHAAGSGASLQMQPQQSER